VDHFYCVSPQKEHRQFFYRIGIPENKCIWGEPARAILPDRLLMLNGPFWNYCANPWAVDFLRRHFQPQVAKPWRKIYIRRTGRRKIINETELLPHLEAMGFEIYEWKEGVDRQIQFFAESSVVVGVHGADLANIIFCVPGSRVLEIVPTDLVARYFYHVSEASGLLHYHLVGDSLTQRPKGDKGTSDADIRVDPAEFRQALEQICQP
jgi:capsular polysaccharide biosynthesis protein